MFDSNNSKDEGVSVWGHMLDGAATGGLAGLALGGIGAVPGVIGGGLVGLANGLAHWYQEESAIDNFIGAKHDDKTVDKVMGHLESLAMDPSSAGVSDEAAVRKASSKVVYEQRFDDEKKRGSSWFDNLF
jgi:hypothetical protein